MIINEESRLAFIHNPKCAGTAARKALDPINDLSKTYITGHLERTTGNTVYGHIPLFVARKYFPEEYIKIKTYKSYALIRNPFERFRSSVTQHCKEKGSRVRDLTKEQLKSVVDEVIGELELKDGKEMLLGDKYIYFQRQKDFVYDKNNKIIKNVFLYQNIGLMLDFIESHHNLSLERITEAKSGSVNRAFTYKDMKSKCLYKTIKPLANVIPQARARRKMRSRVYERFLKPIGEYHIDIFNSTYVKDFIRHYYKEDIVLFGDVRDKNRV